MTPDIRTVNIPVFIPHMGCPHDCVFCDQKSITQQYSAPAGEDVKGVIEKSITELDMIPGEKRIEVAFFGGSFTAIDNSLRQELLDAAYPYVQSGQVDGIRISTRPDYIDKDVLNQLKSRGVTAVELGVQSMDEEVLRHSRRGHTSEDVKKAAPLIREYGLSLTLQMMSGLPFDTPEKSLYTADEIILQKPYGVRIYPAVALPGTKLYSMAEQGKYTPHTVCDAVGICSKLIPKFLSADIKILRIGLMANEMLSRSKVLGAYHPALGELCYSEVFYNAAREQIAKKGLSGDVMLYVPRGAVSKMAGIKRRNIDRLKGEFHIGKIKITQTDELEKCQVIAEAIR